jgi:hypothetical protein
MQFLVVLVLVAVEHLRLYLDLLQLMLVVVVAEVRKMVHLQGVADQVVGALALQAQLQGLLELLIQVVVVVGLVVMHQTTVQVALAVLELSLLKSLVR